MKYFAPSLAAAVLYGAVVASVHSAVIDFEGFAAGRIIDDEYMPAVYVGAHNDRRGPDAAVVFDTGSPTGGDTDLAAPFSSPRFPGLSDDYDPGNVLILQERIDCDFSTGFCAEPDDQAGSRAGELFFLFAEPVKLTSIDFFDFNWTETRRGRHNRIHLLDEHGADLLRPHPRVPYTGGDNTWGRLEFGVEGVVGIVIELDGSGAVDNIAYEDSYVVPVPAAAWLFGSGLIGLVAVSRRQIAA